MSWWNNRITRGIASGGLSEAWNPSNYTGGRTDIVDWAGQRQGASNLPYFEQDRGRLQTLMNQGYDPAAYGGSHGPEYGPYSRAAQVGDDRYQGDVDENLRRQLAMARGEGPSLAAQQFGTAHQEGVNAVAGLAAGGRGAQGARFAAQQAARMGAGRASGLAEARTREQMAAQSAYTTSLGQAQGAAFGREALNAQLSQQTGLANQQAYLDLLAKQLGMSAQQLQAAMANGQLPTNLDRALNVAGTVGPMLAGGPPAGAMQGGKGVGPRPVNVQADPYRRA